MDMKATVTADSKKSILAVDDDVRMVRALERVLRGDGMDVIPAFGSCQALEILTRRQRKLDLVLTDLLMPSLVDGMMLLSAIHKLFPALPVVVLTGVGSPQIRAECLRRGAAAYLEKPFDSEQLLSGVKQALSEETNSNQRESTKDFRGRSAWKGK
jgi:two-component system response regulator GlrR